MLRMSQLGLRVAPVGAWMEGEQLCLRFGPLYDLPDPGDLPSSEVDRRVSYEVMARIAALLPEAMRGEFTLTNPNF